MHLCLVLTPSTNHLQADFNSAFKAAQNSRRAEVDKILDANNRMKEVWEEQARVGSSSGAGAGAGAGEGALFQPRAASDDTKDNVLSVKVKALASFIPVSRDSPALHPSPSRVSPIHHPFSLPCQRYEWLWR